MRIVFLTTGTRGDVQPVVTIACGAKAAGHSVRVVTNACYKSFIESHDLEFYAMGGDPEAMMRSKEVQEALAVGDVMKMLRLTAPVGRQIMLDSFAAAETGTSGADLLVSTPMAITPTFCMAEKLGVPMAVLGLVPIHPSAELPNVVFGAPPGAPPDAIVAGHAMMCKGGWKNSADLVNEWRTKTLGLPPIVCELGLTGILYTMGVPTVTAFSHHIVPRPSDYPSAVIEGAYLYLDTDGTAKLDDVLEAFLSAGPKPVFLSFGSMPAPDPGSLADLAVEVVRRLGKRVVLAAGWTDGLDASTFPDEVLLIKGAPYRALFPRCCAIVHHVGAGTAAAVLRSGTPSVPCPVLMDQPFWARRMFELGVASEPLPFSKVTADGLIDRLTQAMAPSVVEAAAALGEKIQAEGDGVSQVLAGLLKAAEMGPVVARMNPGSLTTEHIDARFPGSEARVSGGKDEEEVEATGSLFA